MKKTVSILIAVSMLAFTVLVAQNNTDSTTKKKSDTNYTKRNSDGSYSSKKHNEAERPEDTYLAKFHAQDVVAKLMKKNLEQVYLLKVIKMNFKDKGWDEDYKKAYAGYKKGMELYYKRNLIYSRLELENNKKDLQKILKKVALVYKDKSLKMLEECAGRILALHLEATTRSDPNRHDHLYANQSRLRIAYGQYDDAISAITSKHFETSIYHFRVAKSYGIKILESLAGEKIKDVKDKYKFDKADNLNRIFEIKEEKKTQ